MIKLIATNSIRFKELEKNPEYIYFLSDTKEVYKGDVNYTESILTVDSLPKLALANKIYFAKDTKTCHVWSGEEWININSSNIEISGSLTDDETATGLVSGEAIKAYITKKISEISLEGTTIDLSADKIKTTKEIEIKGQSIGLFNEGDKIPAGTSIETIIEKQLSKRIPPTYEKPTIEVSLGSTILEELEFGSSVNIVYTPSININDANNENKKFKTVKIINGEETIINNNDLDNLFNLIDINDLPTIKNPIKIISTLDYNEGEIKKDNLGEDYPEGKIEAGTITKETLIYGYMNSYFGTNIEYDNIESQNIKKLNKIKNLKNGDKINIQIKKGDNIVLFAYPEYLQDVSSVISDRLNMNLKDIFEVKNIDIEGTSSYSSAKYKLYIYKPEIPFVSDDIYTITI